MSPSLEDLVGQVWLQKADTPAYPEAEILLGEDVYKIILKIENKVVYGKSISSVEQNWMFSLTSMTPDLITEHANYIGNKETNPEYFL